MFGFIPTKGESPKVQNCKRAVLAVLMCGNRREESALLRDLYTLIAKILWKTRMEESWHFLTKAEET